MDANGLRFWSLSRREDWFGKRVVAENLQWCAETQALRLASQSSVPSALQQATAPQVIRSMPSPVMDRFGNLVIWDGGLKLASNPTGGATGNVISAPGTTPLDMAFGDDDIFYVARDGHIEMIDTRQRFRVKQVSLANFLPSRLAALYGGGVIALDVASGKLARLHGMPLQAGLFPPSPTDQFAPVLDNPNPPRLDALAIAPIMHAADVSASRDGRLAVLSADDADSVSVAIIDDRAVTHHVVLDGVKHAVSVAWVGEAEVAVQVAVADGLADTALVYDAQHDGPSLPSGRIYPLVKALPQPFLNVVSDRPFYAATDGKARALAPVSALTLARQGSVEFTIDSGDVNMIWHRLYLEARIPAGCQIAADIAAANNQQDFLNYSTHLFGGAPASGVPQAAWLDEVSELPHHQGLLRGDRKAGEAGLFSVLIQQSSGNRRRIAGPLLRVRLTFKGDSHASPAVAGIRVYGSRFSYRDQYLPQFYQDAIEPVPDTKRASGPDYLERFLCSLEEPFTLIEGQIAEAHLLMRASSTPAEALPWLGQWVGIDMAAGEASAKDREILKAAPFTARLHGTLGGLRAALEIETGGRFVEGPRFDDEVLLPRVGELAMASAGGKDVRGLVLGTAAEGRGAGAALLAGGYVTSGAIVILEGFRLRRTFATILGADLADEDDELTGGLSFSGNSFVGDSLILGSEFRSDVLALFADTPNAADEDSVIAFFDKLAYRTVVLVHDAATLRDLARLQRVANAESPAHVEVTVLRARYPFLVGAGALIGVDTFLTAREPRGTFEIGRSQVGTADLVVNPGLLAQPSKGQQT